MQLLEQFITRFLGESDPDRQALGRALEKTKQSYGFLSGQDPKKAFTGVVDRYNWLGRPATKSKYKINQNLARNLPGALMQDYLIYLVIDRLQRSPTLDVFTEVRVPFGRYPLWKGGKIVFRSPAQLIDLAVGYKMRDGEPVISKDPWPRPPIAHLETGEVVLPLVVINSKIRVSQGEFFDWLGRDELLTRGNPDCLSLQVALRSEMDLSIIDAAQAHEKFVLLGRGGETSVVGDREELKRLVELLDMHLLNHMTS